MPYAAMNPGKYHLGNAFNFPPLQNRKYIDKNIIKKIMWKTAVLLNRRIYVGNVKITDKDGKVEVLMIVYLNQGLISLTLLLLIGGLMLLSEMVSK